MIRCPERHVIGRRGQIALSKTFDARVQAALKRGLAIPACPLALTGARRFDERRQRGLIRYYLDAGAGGIAVGVHTTQFSIRNPQCRLFRPVLQLVADEIGRNERSFEAPVARIAGVCGPTRQALVEAEFVRECGFHYALLSLGALKTASEAELLQHCRQVAEVIPVIGFYLQPAAGGRLLSYSFWRQLFEIDNVAGIKVAPFNRYQTVDVRAVAESGRDDLRLYTGNDDPSCWIDYSVPVPGRRWDDGAALSAVCWSMGGLDEQSG